MPVQVEWDDGAHTTLYFAFVRPWAWDQFFEASARSQALIRASAHMVYTICDTCRAGAFPLGSITQIRKALQSLAPNTGGTVAVGITPPIRVIIELFQRMNVPIARQWTIAANADEAREIIAAWKAAAHKERLEAGN